MMYSALLVMGCAEPNFVSSAPQRSEATNLLIIVADDLGHNDLAITNKNLDVQTPNLDSLAREGMRFHRHYAATVCSPARAALLTGLHPERLGFLPNGRGIPEEVVTLPEHLAAHGFSTWHLGKWHVGDKDRQAWPDQQGFQYWLGFLNQWRLAGSIKNQKIALSRPRYNNPYLEGSAEPGKHYEGHLEDILTEKAATLLSTLAREEQPWFMHLAYYAPHAPMEPAARFAKLYPDTDEGRYKALVHQLDDNVGHLLDTMEALDLLESTIVVVVSDNGGTTHHYKASNAPFYGRKSTLTEGGLRAPLIIRWPEATLQGRVIREVITIEDLYPTLVMALGITPPSSLDGLNYFDALTGDQPFPQRALFWDDGYATRSFGALSADGRWRLYQPLPFYGAIVDRKLYDLDNDETASVHVENASVEKQLLEQYKDWYEDVHTIATAFKPLDDGLFALQGNDFLRSPGFGGYTFGFAVQGNEQGFMAGQEGIWQLTRQGHKVSAEFGAITLSGTLDETKPCQSLVISGRFDRKSAGFEPRSSYLLALYIDGEQQALETVKGVLESVQIERPTLVNLGVADSTPQPPVLLNSMLTDTSPITVQAFSERFCDARNALN